MSHQVLTTHLLTTKTHVHNFTSHYVTINHIMFTCISQIDTFHFALLNLHNNILKLHQKKLLLGINLTTFFDLLF